MKITIYELLGMVRDKPDRSIYIKYFDRVNQKNDVMWACKENIIFKLDQVIIELNDEVEIIDDEDEEKRLPKKLNIELNSGDENKVNYYRATNLECDLAFKINSIIDYLEKQR